jgi:large subunit ribosomal protein L32e
MKDLLKIKKEKKSNKFIRQDTHKKKKLDKIWRKPRGHHSKLRQQQNQRVMVKPGYGVPVELKGKTVEGMNIVLVSSLQQISTLDPKKDVCVVSGKVGLKKRLVLIDALLPTKVKIINFSDAEKYSKEKKELLASRKAEVKEEKKEKKSKATKKDSIEDKVDDEEKKKLEKKEIDRLLTKKF